MAKISDPRLKLTVRLKNKLGREFHQFCYDHATTKNVVMERLVQGLVDGKIILPPR